MFKNSTTESTKPRLIVTTVLMFLLFAVSAQDGGFIYGKVTTFDGSYEGNLRWGKEEIYWTDFFNASKEDNDFIDQLSDREREHLEDHYHVSRNGNWMVNVSINWEDSHLHQFVCQFGELKSIKPYRGDMVKIELQNGERFTLDGSGYNDVGTDIRIMDQELGEVEIDWDRIEMIEFMETPKQLDEKFGDPLYGTVESDEGQFTGFIQWDHDERVTNDKLDGDTEDGDISVKFGKLQSIEKISSSRSLITLKSGRELELRGSNDVNAENRGIIVTVEGLGRVDIPWEDFESVTFMAAPKSIVTYRDFKNQDKLSGTVTVTNGDVHKGEIAYDLDESMVLEILHGKVYDTEYLIPFRNIASIAPRNDEESIVTLKNGDELILEESQDVTERNSGALVYSGGEPVYIPWKKIEKIDFE
ncbi:MAG: hypothetical protein JXQ90_00980 [Cyclobacteriaceae bacterium]